jgi:hypothetical protein
MWYYQGRLTPITWTRDGPGRLRRVCVGLKVSSLACLKGLNVLRGVRLNWSLKDLKQQMLVEYATSH